MHTLPRPIAAAAVAAAMLLAVAPLVGSPPVVRVSAVLLPVAVLSLVWPRPWRWSESQWQALLRWQPSTRAIGALAVALGLVLFWIVLTRFKSAEINAVDFTTYFDRPLFQTSRGRVFFVETTDDPAFARLSHLSFHAYWALVPLAAFYLLHASPIWLLVLSVAAVVAGAVHVLRIARHFGGGGALAVATALAYVFNDNTARTLNYGFHAEVLYAWFIPWLLDAGLRGARRSFLMAAVACVLVKEDACLPIFASAVTLALVRGRSMTMPDRVLFLVAPTALALANLVVYYELIVPAWSPNGEVMYAHFWANYGPTPFLALRGMLLQPWRVLHDAWTSGLLSIVAPAHLLVLPLIGWRWSIGTLPIVLIFGASADGQLRMYGIYYSIVLVPFFVLAASAGTAALARRLTTSAGGPVVASAVLLLGTLSVGLGYSLRPWRAATASVADALERLSDERTVLVQSGLYPHAGYSTRVQLLTPDTVRDPSNAGAAILIAADVSTYPFSSDEFNDLVQQLPVIGSMDGGLVAVRMKVSDP